MQIPIMAIIRHIDGMEQPGSTFSLRDIKNSIAKFSYEDQLRDKISIYAKICSSRT